MVIFYDVKFGVLDIKLLAWGVVRFLVSVAIDKAAVVEYVWGAKGVGIGFILDCDQDVDCAILVDVTISHYPRLVLLVIVVELNIVIFE